MTASLAAIDDLLLTPKAIWKQHGVPTPKFEGFNAERRPAHYTCQPLYAVNYDRPLFPFHRYYVNLISDISATFVNTVHADMTAAETPEEKAYLVHAILEKMVHGKLEHASTALRQRTAHRQRIDHNGGSLQEVQRCEAELFILGYLKWQLIRLYLEVQDAFADLSAEDKLDAGDVHQKYFGERVATEQYITVTKTIETAELLPALEPEQAFEPRAYDFRGVMPRGRSYSDIVKHSEKLSGAERELFNQGLIDKDYNFIGKHGTKTLMAAAYHAMTARGYFNERVFNPPKKIDEALIRRFLNHRYQVAIDKLARGFNNPETWKKYLDDHIWLGKFLPG